jgi:hypothetical protein
VIEKDGEQVLVKHGETYVRVHTCRLQHASSNDEPLSDIENCATQSTQDIKLENEADVAKQQNYISDSDSVGIPAEL